MQLLANEIEDFTEPTGEIEVDEFPGNCGIRVIHSLQQFANEKTALALLKAAMENSDETTAKGMAMYTTIPRQEKVIAVLKEAGFVSVATCKNPSSNNDMTLWVKVITPASTPARTRAARSAARPARRRTARRRS